METQQIMSKTEVRLRVFAKWLQNESHSIEQGELERFVNNQVNEVKRDIGEILEEILDLPEEDLLHSLNDLNK